MSLLNDWTKHCSYSKTKIRIGFTLAIPLLISGCQIPQAPDSQRAIASVTQDQKIIQTDSVADLPGLDKEVKRQKPEPTVDRIRNAKERQRMERYLKDFVRSEDVVSRFTAPDGDLISCVDMKRQPALRRKGMEDHVLQKRPRNPPKEKPSSGKPEHQDFGDPKQAFSEKGPGCEQGSIPIRRVTMDTLKNFETLDEYLSKTPPRDGPTSLHQYAKADKFVSNWGGESVFNVWKPYTERADEFTLSQIWVVRGSGNNKETIEGGWQKYHDKYGDYRSRLFIYFTPDNYDSDGCYNLDCGAFVQVNNSVFIGGAFSNYSSHDGPQHTFKLLWYKDGENGHWWLRYGSTWVGYYPRTLFDSNGLRNFASRTSFGGEIINRDINSQHTRTDMGSGYMPSYGFRWAAYQRSIRYVDTNNFYRQASNMSDFVSDRNCYDIDLRSSSGSWEQYFYFGGWGYNAQCE